MPRFHGLFRVLGLVAALLWVGLPASQAASLPSTGLKGTVKSSEGKPMEGVAVSARASDKTFTTSVYTNRDGEYFFPPLADGQYRIWAQAVGFEAARSEMAVSSGKKILQNFALKPFKDFHKQLSSTEWTDSLPDDTSQDARMKRVIHYNCGSCHIAGFVLSKRFDATGWGIIINTMIEHFTPPEAPIRKLHQSYKEELVEYLSRVRGPQPYPLKFKLHPRATGEATQIVVTEYDLPLGDQADRLLSHNGSDWSEGTISRRMGEALHDAVVAKDGNVYFSDNEIPERTIGKLDPKTGRVTNYKLADKNNLAVRTHGAIADPQGNIWFNGPEGTIMKFDPATEKFQLFPKPEGGGRAGGHIDVDSKGNVWTSANIGVVKLNPATGEYTDYKSITPGGTPYGLTIDAEDNAWMAQLGIDKLMVVNGRTGEVSEVVLAPLEDISEKDREISQRIGAGDARGAPLDHKGPRRLGADKNGDAVWVAEIYAGRLAKIDIHTKKVTEYPLPNKYSQPYTAIVDKNHMVWVPLLNSDYVAKFNPFTEQFTEYPLPTLRTENRFIDVDDSTDPPTVWLPYSQAAKIGRVQLRPDSAGQGKLAVSTR